MAYIPGLSRQIRGLTGKVGRVPSLSSPYAAMGDFSMGKIQSDIAKGVQPSIAQEPEPKQQALPISPGLATPAGEDIAGSEWGKTTIQKAITDIAKPSPISMGLKTLAKSGKKALEASELGAKAKDAAWFGAKTLPLFAFVNMLNYTGKGISMDIAEKALQDIASKHGIEEDSPTMNNAISRAKDVYTALGEDEDIGFEAMETIADDKIATEVLDKFLDLSNSPRTLSGYAWAGLKKGGKKIIDWAKNIFEEPRSPEAFGLGATTELGAGFESMAKNLEGLPQIAGAAETITKGFESLAKSLEATLPDLVEGKAVDGISIGLGELGGVSTPSSGQTFGGVTGEAPGESYGGGYGVYGGYGGDAADFGW